MSADVIGQIVFWSMFAVLWALQWTSRLWAPCDCDRTRRWVFYAGRHERQWSFIVQAVLVTALAIMTMLSLHPSAVLWGALAGYAWWRVKVHGDGKRKWPRKVAGVVRINEHGRLVVER